MKWMDANKTSAIKRRDEVHRMAEANKLLLLFLL
jgi:ribosomal protein S7